MKQKIITIFILCMCILGLTITQSININEASISTKNIEALASSESINFEFKTAGGICWKNNLPTYGIHFEVPEK